jgi:hypothetical protein
MTSYQEGEGILAAWDEWIPMYPRGERERKKLKDEVHAHLDWSNRDPTPFISVTTDEEWAFEQANRRREEQERRDIVVYEICAEGNRGVHWGRVGTWLRRAGSETPEYAAFRSTENEYLFLHHIPEEFIVGTWTGFEE